VLKYAVFWFVFRVLGRLPLPVLYAIAEIVARASYTLARRSRENVWDNLRHAAPGTSKRHLRRCALNVFRNVAKYYADLAHLPRMDIDKFLRERLVYHGIEEHVRPNLERGRGVVMLSAHMGNVELAGQGLVPLGILAFAVTEPVKPDALSRMLNGIRASKGHEFQPVSVASAKRIVRTLRSGGTVALMGDRDIHGPKMLLPYFGEETWMPTGPIEVALRTNAAIVPSFSMRRGRYGIEAIAEPPIEIERTDDFQADVRTAMLEYIRRLEGRLRAEPEQWMVLERIWDVEKAAPVSAAEPEKVVA
jgi:KDO2-lipid IV(A) lauroyltransferase